MSTLTIDVVRCVRAGAPVSQRTVRAVIRCAARVLRTSVDGGVTIVYVGDARMRELNARYRGKDHTTDVLSFCYRYRRQKSSVTVEGELFLARPVLVRAARREHTTLGDATRARIIHGFLHLLGYDHERSAKEEAIMFGLQERIERCMKNKR